MRMNNNLYASIILAGGCSSRMGKFKPLLPIGDVTIADRIISLFMQINVETYLITGWNDIELRTGIKRSNVTILENSDFKKGMLSTLKVGVRHLKTSCKGFFIMPVDIPLIRTSSINRLLDAAASYPDKIIYPVFNKAHGHPPLIPSSLIPEILSQTNDSSLRNVLDKHKENVLEVKVADQNILFDIDSPQDYQQALQRFQSYGVPCEDECEAILSDICSISNEIRRHGLKVSEVACKIGEILLKSGKSINLDIIHTAALLHDIAKGSKKHDLAGGQILKDLGFFKTSEVVSTHSDLPDDNANISLETKIVYLADKFVKGENIVSLDERYLTSSRPFVVTPEIEAKIRQRKLRAIKVKLEIESLLGCSVESIIRSDT
jgi:molybdenum cofactor cytidylyltransferase